MADGMHYSGAWWVLGFVFFLYALVVFFQRFNKCQERRRRLAQDLSPHEWPAQTPPGTPTAAAETYNKELERSVLGSLPAFEYDSASVKGDAPPECIVCLSEFQDTELCRTLPACNHAFHADCIDMWFSLHPTCPICRATVQPVKDPAQAMKPDSDDESNDDPVQLDSLRERAMDTTELVEINVEVPPTESGSPREPTEVIELVVESGTGG